MQYLMYKFSLDRKTAEAIGYLLTGYIRLRTFSFEEAEREKGLVYHLQKFVKDGLVLVELMEFVRWLDKEYWSLTNRKDWWKYLDDWDRE